MKESLILGVFTREKDLSFLPQGISEIDSIGAHKK